MTTYAPKDPAASNSTSRSYFLRTTPVPAVPPAAPKYGSIELVRYLYRQYDLFDPTMLQRYLLGYEPGQSELERFCNDPLSVHFSVAHAALLADRYGFKLQLGIRRTDAAGDDGEKPGLPAFRGTCSASPRSTTRCSRGSRRLRELTASRSSSP